MAVATYAYDSSLQLSQHFNIREFRCKCGRGHATKFDANLCKKLEQLYMAFDCSKIIVNSGYRCYDHDRAVGGAGKGRHTVGDAADIICYDKQGKPISTKLISCVAVELGFGGVANINKIYTAIHLDNRTGKYYGDEVYGYSSIWNQIGLGGKKADNFYAYYGITKSDIAVYLKRAGISTIDESISKKKSSTGQSGNNPDLTKWTNKYDVAVKSLQTILKDLGNNIKADGIAGPKTYSAVITNEVKNGTKGDLVKWVQSRLTTMGYNVGAIDGISGPKTMNAIEAMKKDYGVTTVSNLSGVAFYYLLVM